MTNTNINSVTILFQQALTARQIAENFSKESHVFMNRFDKIVSTEFGCDSFIKGVNRIVKMTGYPVAEIAQFFAVTNKKDKHYIPQKGLSKTLGLIAFLGGDRAHADNFLKLVMFAVTELDNLTYGQRGILKNAVNGAKFDLQKTREYLGYLSAQSSEAMDILIDLGRPDYNQSTINTQASQIKTTLCALGLATSIKNTGAVIEFSDRFVREMIANKDSIETRNYHY